MPAAWGATENPVCLGSSEAPHTSSWNDRMTTWVSGFPCSCSSAIDSQFGGRAGYPKNGGLSFGASDV